MNTFIISFTATLTAVLTVRLIDTYTNYLRRRSEETTEEDVESILKALNRQFKNKFNKQ
tara:strand:+ start:281 stop:457 length:177 start_codon:yes stop_codon:yes gene_type:complete